MVRSTGDLDQIYRVALGLQRLDRPTNLGRTLRHRIRRRMKYADAARILSAVVVLTQRRQRARDADQVAHDEWARVKM